MTLIVSKFNLQKADLIRLCQVWLLFFLLISLFIYFDQGLRLAIDKKLANPRPRLKLINKLLRKTTTTKPDLARSGQLSDG